jgi:RNA polymerase sigma-70 factor (ECF subfamily)
VIEQDIKRLVEKAILGEEDAFVELCQKKSRDILYYVSKLTPNKDDAEDLAQEVIINMYKSIRNLKQADAFYAWMHRIITNLCFRALNRRKSEAGVVLNDIDKFDNILIEDKTEFLPDQYLQQKDVKRRIMDIVNKLPRKKREAVIMYYYDDMSYAEIAYALNVSVSTISTNLLRAKESIRKELEEVENQMGEVIDFNFRKNSKIGVPLIAQALRDDVAATFPAEAVEHFRQQWSRALVLYKQGAATAGAHAGILSGKAAIACIVAGMVAVGGGVFVATGQFAPLGSPEPVAGLNNGEIAFVGGDCECGHVNPDDVRALGVRLAEGDATWRVMTNDDGRVLYNGDGEGIPAFLAQLYDEGADGSYTVRYDQRDEQGNRIQISRGFLINTGDFPAGIYR